MTQTRPAEDGPVLILASASPRRRELISKLGVPFRVVVADVDEQVLPRESPHDLTMRLSQTKALTIAGRLQGGADGLLANDPVVVAADTVVALDGAILNKPADAAEAREMLQRLRERTHHVFTGLAVAVGGSIGWCSVVETRVTMRPYSDDEVTRYIATGAPFDKAGGYGIQDHDFRPVAQIDGCYANVVGLPLCEVRRALAAIDPARTWGADTMASGPDAASNGTGGRPCDCGTLEIRWYGAPVR